ncbi:hypothetical protein [Schaalia vaccimaxillae]|uniref:hypothetical protein n=1 Tax=Schaalia vaccimaxillae TaxID=183916 RepID=UPI0003B637BB|nr:hypothetical protein [Schaalia vaccimaxillae]
MEQIRFELSDAGTIKPVPLAKARRNVNALRMAGTALLLLVCIASALSFMKKEWSAEIILGLIIVSGLALVLLNTARYRRAWIAAHANSNSLTFGVTYAFALNDNSLIFPAQPGRSSEIWPLDSVEVTIKGTESKKWLILHSPKRGKRRYPQFVLEQDVTQVADIIRRAASARR